MEEIYRNNFIDAAKGAQKAIFTATITSVTLFSLAILEKIDNIKFPLSGVEVDAVSGLWMIMAFYFSAGIFLCFLLSRAKTNIELITCTNTIKVLQLYPSIACGSRFFRVFSALIPVILFFIAMWKAYSGHTFNVIIMTTISSMPYLLALQIIWDTGANKSRNDKKKSIPWIARVFRPDAPQPPSQKS